MHMLENGRVFTLANGVTLLRLALALPAGYLALAGGEGAGRVAALAVFLAAALSDGLDGYLARSRNEVSGFGQLVDPIADKALGIAVMGALVLRGSLPAWALWALVIKEGLLVLGGGVILRTGGRVIAARLPGKIATVVLFTGIAALLAGLEALGRPVVLAGVGLSLVAGVDYAVRVLRR